MPRRRAVSVDAVKRLALALPEAVESHHFAISDIRVLNKIFVSFPKGGELVGLKCTPANVDALVSADGDTFRDLWRGRWLGVRLDRVTLPVLQELIADAWKLAAPKRIAKTRPESAKAKETVTVKQYGGRFTAKLFRYPGAGGRTFIEVPERSAPRVTHRWGRTPVEAVVDGYCWKTSVWRGKGRPDSSCYPQACARHERRWRFREGAAHLLVVVIDAELISRRFRVAP